MCVSSIKRYYLVTHFLIDLEGKLYSLRINLEMDPLPSRKCCVAVATVFTSKPRPFLQLTVYDWWMLGRLILIGGVCGSVGGA